jgi:hypothetical protein
MLKEKNDTILKSVPYRFLNCQNSLYLFFNPPPVLEHSDVRFGIEKYRHSGKPPQLICSIKYQSSIRSSSWVPY